MKKTKNKILNLLVDKYERSKCSVKEVKRTIKIKLKTEIDLPFYYESLTNKELVDEVLQELASKNWVFVLYKDFDAVEITLNTEENVIDEIYLFLGKKTKRNISKDCIEFLTSVQTCGFVSDFKEYLLTKLRKKESIARYFNAENITEVAETFAVLNSLFKLKEETLFRDFSTNVLHDSKRFGKMQGRIVRIIKNFTDLSFEEDDEYLSAFNLFKNPNSVWLKGNVIFKLGEQVVDLEKWGREFVLSSSVINEVNICSLNVNKVITTENLTTFFSCSFDNSLVIYLGGYHSAAIRHLLKKLYSKNAVAQYYHFGDIDAGGFYILEHLRKRTEIPFSPYKMDVGTLKENMKYTRPLTKNDKQRLNNIKNEEFQEVINYMLLNNCKLEQEALD